jgi:hypothetical protein
MKYLAILAVAVAALIAVSAAPAASAGAGCTYKMTGFPIYMTMTGAAARVACDEVGVGAKGSLVRIYTSPRGAARCGFEYGSGAAVATVRSPNAVYGAVACPLLAKSLRKSGWTRIF